MMKSLARLLLAGVLLFGPAPAFAQAGRTIVTDPAALARLQRNSGVTLQWISFESPARGHVRLTREGGLYRLRGEQRSRRDSGRLTLDGVVTAIGPRSFRFEGRIVITDAPDRGRECVRDGGFDFLVTGRRRYWRLQQMEVCDGLTDYVDIYF
jgi:hypothetical protein